LRNLEEASRPEHPGVDDDETLVTVRSFDAAQGATIQIKGLNDLPLCVDDLRADSFGCNADEARRKLSREHLEAQSVFEFSLRVEGSKIHAAAQTPSYARVRLQAQTQAKD
jgi:hypothetical protein